MLARALRPVFAAASRSGTGNCLSVLIYHRVTPVADALLPYEPDAADFERSMRWVSNTYNVLPLDAAARALAEDRLPARALAITFDDGYANNATVAAPILAKLGLPATFFIATGYLDGGCMFNDVVVEAVRGCRRDALDVSAIGLGTHPLQTDGQRLAAIDALLRAVKYLPEDERNSTVRRIAAVAGVPTPTDLMMTSEQAAGLARAGFALGAHTVSHPILARTDLDAARREIERSRLRVADLAGQPVTLFAYPNGRPDTDYTRATAALVRDMGFAAAVSTSMGVARPQSDVFQIPRFTPWDRRPMRYAWQMLSNMTRVRATYAT